MRFSILRQVRWMLQIALLPFVVIGVWAVANWSVQAMQMLRQEPSQRSTEGSWTVREAQAYWQEPSQRSTDPVIVQVGSCYNWSVGQACMKVGADLPHQEIVVEMYDHDGQQTMLIYISGVREHAFAILGAEGRYIRGEPPIELKPAGGGTPLAMR